MAETADVATVVRSGDEMIPMSLWGRDHWSTLAYAETVMVDCGGFQVGLDARMRHHRRHYRVMSELCKRPMRAGGNRSMPIVMDPEKHRTRLNDGSEVAKHDDWSCIQDMAAEGLFTVPADEIEPGVVLRLSPLGQKVAQWVRAQKMAEVSFGQMRAHRDQFADEAA